MKAHMWFPTLIPSTELTAWTSPSRVFTVKGTNGVVRNNLVRSSFIPECTVYLILKPNLCNLSIWD
jgi:hypothetical protein